MPLTDLYEKIEKIRTFDVVAETMNIIREYSETISDILAMQLSQGKDKNNEPVTIFGRDTYRPFTIEMKERYGTGLGKVVDVITNYMSGAFYLNLFVETEGTNFNVKSDVPYFEKILERSGNKIMELNQEHLELFTTEVLYPNLQKRFAEHLNGI